MFTDQTMCNIVSHTIAFFVGMPPLKFTLFLQTLCYILTILSKSTLAIVMLCLIASLFQKHKLVVSAGMVNCLWRPTIVLILILPRSYLIIRISFQH